MSKKHDTEQQTPAEEAIGIAAETMAGDLMQCLIDELKTAPRVWQEMPEHQQQDVIYRAQERVQSAIKRRSRSSPAPTGPPLWRRWRASP